jgi:hypothetical protein
MGSAAVNGVDPGAVEIHRRFGTDVINRSGISTRDLQTTTNTIRHLKHALERLVHYSTKLKDPRHAWDPKILTCIRHALRRHCAADACSFVDREILPDKSQFRRFEPDSMFVHMSR